MVALKFAIPAPQDMVTLDFWEFDPIISTHKRRVLITIANHNQIRVLFS